MDRAWRENLKLVKDSEMQATVYHNLRLLLEETDQSKFELLLHETVKQLKKSSSTASFGDYFQTHYAKNKKRWAACYRKEAFVNTNMYVEAFHRVLKYVYMKGKVNKRLDNCIYILLKLARDKGFERLVKMEKGKNTEKLMMIKARHQSSLKLPYAQITESENPSMWKVLSSDNETNYSVIHVPTPPYFDVRNVMYVYTCLCATVLMLQSEPLFANIYILLQGLFQESLQ